MKNNKLKCKIANSIKKEYTIICESMKHGGNGLISEVADIRNGGHYIVKSLRHNDKKSRKRFENEIRMLRECKDMPGVIPLLKSDPENTWYSMPIGKPIDLEELHNALMLSTMPDARDGDDVLENGVGKTLRKFIEQFLGLAETLLKLHKRGIAHRDIKPANIVFYDNRLVFIDFGISRDVSAAVDLTRNAKSLGAKFTMSPEMRRNPAIADYYKADVYSLAKTLWIFLTGEVTCFDGPYSPWDDNCSLRSDAHYHNVHLAEIEELLMGATDADPRKRLSMGDFVQYLRNWLEAEKYYAKVEESEWKFWGKLLSGNYLAETMVWRNYDDIKKVLKMVARTLTSSHVLYSDGGGHDFDGVVEVGEQGCIGLMLSNLEIMKPAVLWFEHFPEHESWDYLLLELADIPPCGSLGNIEEEELTEDSSGHYVSPDCILYGVYDYDKGGALPSTARYVIRRLRGKLLFPFKYGHYNYDFRDYDGSHGKFSAQEFREYITLMIATFDKAEKLKKRRSSCGCFPDINREMMTPDVREMKINKDIVSANADMLEQVMRWRYTGVLEHGAASCKLKFGFRFHPFFHASYPSNTRFLLNVSGQIAKADSNGITPFFVYNVTDAEVLVGRLNSWINELCNRAGYLETSYRAFTIIPLRNAYPSHMFNRDELKDILLNADDRCQNTLVVDDDGYLKMITDRSIAWKYAVEVRIFDMYTRSVGKYSNVESLDEIYKEVLSYWLFYLKNGCDSHNKLFPHESIEELEKKCAFYMSSHS